VRFILASASPTRLRVLRDAGFDPEVVVTGVDEDVEGEAHSVAALLAERKARALDVGDAVVLGCDSVVEHDGRVLAKPADGDEACAWLRSFRGSAVTVWSGHCVVLGDRCAVATPSAVVHFGAPTDTEIERYVATGEPMGAAGAFRLHGRAAAFVDAVERDPGTVHGVSIATLRSLLHDLDVEITDLWV
jgi:septum formation protein